MQDNRVRQTRGYYVEGNTVRSEAVPQRRPSRVPTVREQEEIRRRQESARATRRNREKAFGIDFKYLAFLSVMVSLIFVSSFLFLRNSAKLFELSSSVSALQNEANLITNLNQATSERLNYAIDLDEVYTVASSELGMKYASEDQILYYHSTNSDYVKQYKDIPN